MRYLKHIMMRLFPKMRQQFQWRMLTPLILYIIFFAILTVSLEYYNVLTFMYLAPFWLTLLFPWIWWMYQAGYSGIRGVRGVIALWIRLIMVSLFIYLLAEPQAVRESDTLSVIYVLDISDSVDHSSVNKASMFMTRTVTQGRKGKDKAGLVIFGKDAAVDLPPRESFTFENIKTLINKDGSSIAKGLSLASAIISNSENGRIVLISDGVGTEGDLNGTLDELRAREIPVDVLPIDYHFNKEVWLEKLELPVVVKLGETYKASVILNALSSGTGELTLLENGVVISKQKVTYKKGKNHFTLPLYLRQAGYYEYTAKIKVPKGEDGWEKNNIAMNYLYLKGKGKVAVLYDPDGDQRDWEFLVKALRNEKLDVELVDPLDLPEDAASLLPYDMIIFANVAADQFDSLQLQAIHDAVYNQGTGVLMVGGGNSFGPGGYHRTPVEKLLPVDMDISNKKVLPKAGLVIILHTCEFADGNTWAKRIAKAAIKVLGKQDEVGLLAWEGGEKWVFPMTPVAEYKKLVSKINKANPGDMPSFVGTMTMGLKGLIKSNAAEKHMIIISDGDPMPPQPGLIKKFIANKITISTVLVDGYHRGNFQQVMHSIADATGGRFYYPKNPNQLPSIFIKEAKTLKRSMIQNKTFVPTIEYADPTLLKGINAFPPLYGYVLTSAKNDARRCTTILRGPDTEQLDPVLAIGHYGIGKTAAFTSDLSSNWGKDWLQWKGYQPFLKQLVTAVSRVNKISNLRMRAYTSGNMGYISIDDYAPTDDILDIAATISGPNHKQKIVQLEQTGLRQYQASFPLWGKGRYQILAVGTGGNHREERAVGGIVIPYSVEYLRFRASPAVLEHIADITKGRVLTGKETGKELFKVKRKQRLATRPIFPIFLILLALLLPLDVGVRRIQIEMDKVLGFFRTKKKSKESSERLGALLKAKQKSQEKQSNTPHATDTYRPKMQPPTPSPKDKSVASVDTSKQDGKKDEPELSSEARTSSRLLAMKKRKK